MKFFTVNLVILIIVVTSAVESARIRRNEGNKKKSNLAVMLAYKPNSEIRTKDEHDNTWTYQIKSDDQTGSEELNKKLLEILVKQKFGNYGEKAVNKKRQAASSSCESNENIDDAKIVEVKKHKQTCYKNTYKNVLNAFEEALKSQIQSYKKCVCQKKQSTSTTTTTTSTTTTTTEAPIQERTASESEEESDENHLQSEAAIDNSDDVICFHKQYAFMLQKLLDTIPCKKPSGNQIIPTDLKEYEGNESKRHERQNPRDTKSSEEVKNDDELKDQIMNILKDYLSVKKRENVKPMTTTTTTTTPPPPPESIESEENLDEEKFFEKLRKLFQQLESDDDTFPMSKNGTSQSESTTSVPSSKSIKKSKSSVSANASARKSRKTEPSSSEVRRKSSKAVTELSDESTETSIKFKKGKFEKKHFASEEFSRGDSSKGTKHFKNGIHTKSYRTTSRSPATTTTSTTSRAIIISSDNSGYYSSEEEEASKEVSKENRGRNVNDDRLAGNLAKAISDLAKKYLKN